MQNQISSTNHRVTAELLQRTGARRTKRTMPRWERIGQIHELLEDGAYPNSTTLARHLNLTIKTIHRDIAYMRDHLGLPIDFDSHRLGYYYAKTVACKPTQPVSELELFGLLIASRTIAQYTGTEMEASLRATFQKLMPQLDSGDVIVIDDLREVMAEAAHPPELSAQAAYKQLCRALEAQPKAKPAGTAKSIAA